MNKLYSLLLLLSIILLCTCSSSSNFIVKNDKKAKNMKFIPKEFHYIKLGYYETKSNLCSPIFREEMRTINSITINIPQKIECETNDNNSTQVIHVCAIYSLSQRRGLKYDNLSTKMLYIRKVGEETVYSGKIVDKDESPIVLPFNYYEQEKNRQKRIKEAQKYDDGELEQQGLALVNYLRY